MSEKPILEGFHADTVTVLLRNKRYTYAIDLAHRDFIENTFRNAPFEALNFLRGICRWEESEDIKKED